MIVTFITTVRNEQATIGPYLDSLAQQTRVPDEVIIVDGQSTDSTVSEIEARRSLFPRMRAIVRQCNIAEGRNIAVCEAEGDVIAMSDAGCALEKNWLKELVAPMEQDRLVGACCGNWRIEECLGFPGLCRWYFLRGRPGMRDGPSSPTNPSSRSLAIRKSVWLDLGGQPAFLYAGEDTLFNIKMNLVGTRTAFTPDAMCVWRMHTSLRGFGRQVSNYARAGGRLARSESLTELCYQMKACLAYLTICGFISLALLCATSYWPWITAGGLILFATVVLRRKCEDYRRARRYGFGVWRSHQAVLLTFYCEWMILRGIVAGLVDRMRGSYDRLVLEYMARSDGATCSTRSVVKRCE